MKIFEQLGQDIEAEWKSVEYDVNQLPEISAKHLSDFDLLSKTTSSDIVDWALQQTELPEQRDPGAKFGDPPITLFNAPRFHIDVYFWLEGTTSIHQHSFCGAFLVLEGSSIHSHYEFETEEQISDVARVGKMSLLSCELLKPGAIQKILPGQKYIHSLFHLERPSVTIVVRTHSIPLDLPQYEYLKPGFAIDPFYEDLTLNKKLQVLRMTIEAGYPDVSELVKRLLGDSDLYSSYLILMNLRSGSGIDQLKSLFKLEEGDDRFEGLLEVACDKHREYGALMKAVFAEQKKTDHLVRLRSIISDSEQRYFLALLLNLDSREQIVKMIESRFAGSNPIDKILDWISDLTNTRVLDGSFPNGIGIEGMSDFDVVVLEDLLNAVSDSEIMANLVKNCASEEMIEESLKRLRNAPSLRALLK